MNSNNWTTEDFLRYFIEDATKNRKVLAIVEGLQEDENFWEKVFYKFTNKKICLDFPYAEDTKETGKGTFVKFYPFLEQEEFKGQFVICRDSDGEYLYENPHKSCFSLPNLFHTYTYNIESHNCVPEALEKIAKEILRKSYSFKTFFDKYSFISFPLLVRYFWLKEQVFFLEKEIKKVEDSSKEKLIANKLLLDAFLTRSVLKETLKFDKHVTQLSDIEDFLDIFTEKIKQKCENIDSTLIKENIVSAEDFATALTEMENKLTEKMMPTQAHYYWNGHVIFDNLLLPLFEQVRDKIVKSQEENMGKLFSEYRNAAMEFNIKTKLKEAYKESFEEIEHNPFMQKIKQDIEYAYN